MLFRYLIEDYLTKDIFVNLMSNLNLNLNPISFLYYIILYYMILYYIRYCTIII